MDAGVQHRRRRPPRRDLRRGDRRRRRRWSSPSRCSSKVLGEGWEVDRRAFTGRELERWTYQRPFELVEFPRDGARTSSCSPTTSPPRTAPAWCTRPPPSARTTSRSAARYGLPVVNPVRPDGTSRTDVPLVGGAVLQDTPTTTLVDGPRGARAAVPARRLRAQLPALLALPHRAALLRAAVLVHPHHRASRTRCCGRTRRPTGTPTTIKQGRYGDWLNNNIDWALSRSRYWGTPLPIWRCDGGPPDLRRLAAPS